MYAVVRMYTGPGADALFDVLEQRRQDIEKVIRGGVKDLASYTLVRTDQGGVAVTVTQDQASAERSLEIARDWIQKNAASTGAAAPKVMQGNVLLHLEPVTA